MVPNCHQKASKQRRDGVLREWGSLMLCILPYGCFCFFHTECCWFNHKLSCSWITSNHLEKNNSTSLLENPNRNPQSKIQLEIQLKILSRKLNSYDYRFPLGFSLLCWFSADIFWIKIQKHFYHWQSNSNSNNNNNKTITLGAIPKNF